LRNTATSIKNDANLLQNVSIAHRNYYVEAKNMLNLTFATVFELLDEF
jgi:hypothetical protein